MAETAALRPVLGFDYGSQRIGLALGERLTRSARPLASMRNHERPDWPTLDRHVSDWQPAALIVGLPLDEDGGEQAISVAARRFARQLEQRYQRPVHLIDERYSSREADDVLRQARASGQLSRRLRKGDRDSQAARLIVEQWLLQQP